jgi:hypothetical protein
MENTLSNVMRFTNTSGSVEISINGNVIDYSSVYGARQFKLPIVMGEIGTPYPLSEASFEYAKDEFKCRFADTEEVDRLMLERISGCRFVDGQGREGFIFVLSEPLHFAMLFNGRTFHFSEDGLEIC